MWSLFISDHITELCVWWSGWRSEWVSNMWTCCRIFLGVFVVCPLLLGISSYCVKYCGVFMCVSYFGLVVSTCQVID